MGSSMGLKKKAFTRLRRLLDLGQLSLLLLLKLNCFGDEKGDAIGFDCSPQKSKSKSYWVKLDKLLKKKIGIAITNQRRIWKRKSHNPQSIFFASLLGSVIFFYFLKEGFEGNIKGNLVFFRCRFEAHIYSIKFPRFSGLQLWMARIEWWDWDRTEGWWGHLATILRIQPPLRRRCCSGESNSPRSPNPTPLFLTPLSNSLLMPVATLSPFSNLLPLWYSTNLIFKIFTA